MRLYLIMIILFFCLISKAQWPTYQAPDVIDITLNNFKFKDTLIISGYIADCGEFGGYIDRIKIYKTDNRFYGSLIKGESYCNPPLIFSEKYNPYFKNVQIDSLKQRYLLDYIKEFSILAITHTAESNAPTEFWISYKDKNYDRWDPVGKWNKFERLRDIMFKK